jgi:vesicle coat complex subunit
MVIYCTALSFFISVFYSDNEDPLVRGLALRSLCSLRLESILEYVEKPLRKGLDDISAYVRKTAVLGVLKVRCPFPLFLVGVNNFLM